MPCDGSMILSHVRGPTVFIVCEPYGRRRRYGVQRLAERHGPDAKLTDFAPGAREGLSEGMRGGDRG
jgi:hypothetical protein